ncbi:unnamed protein product, partial [Mesorhabditis belari]|uniref:Uncharacterized protein n=1 Tax=Mesorhabditis belari TaxID=2138241 RepID=A0AAF3JB07_9BILA
MPGIDTLIGLRKLSLSDYGIAKKRHNFSDNIIYNDLSLGRERFSLIVVNNEDDAVLNPNHFLYTTRVIDSAGILKERDEEYYEGCSCEASCSASNCSCHNVGYSKDGLLQMDELMEVIYECNAACECTLHCGNRVAQKGATKPVQIFRTKSKGWGVKTMSWLPKGTFIGEYTGELHREGDGAGEYLFETKLGESSCTIDAKKCGNFTRFVNHSCEPNLHAASVIWENCVNPYVHICFFTVRDIDAGEELTVDYGPEWWSENIISFPCRCRSSNCSFNAAVRSEILAERENTGEI